MSKENKQSEFADCFISKQAAMDLANELQISVDGYHMYNQAVNNYCAEIADLPEAIVRCKDCENFQTDWKPLLPDRHYCGVVDSMMKEDDFCSYAERSQDDNNY